MRPKGIIIFKKPDNTILLIREGTYASESKFLGYYLAPRLKTNLDAPKNSYLEEDMSKSIIDYVLENPTEVNKRLSVAKNIIKERYELNDDDFRLMFSSPRLSTTRKQVITSKMLFVMLNENAFNKKTIESIIEAKTRELDNKNKIKVELENKITDTNFYIEEHQTYYNKIFNERELYLKDKYQVEKEITDCNTQISQNDIKIKENLDIFTNMMTNLKTKKKFESQIQPINNDIEEIQKDFLNKIKEFQDKINSKFNNSENDYHESSLKKINMMKETFEKFANFDIMEDIKTINEKQMLEFKENEEKAREVMKDKRELEEKQKEIEKEKGSLNMELLTLKLTISSFDLTIEDCTKRLNQLKSSLTQYQNKLLETVTSMEKVGKTINKKKDLLVADIWVSDGFIKGDIEKGDRVENGVKLDPRNTLEIAKVGIIREVKEEINLDVDESRVKYIGGTPMLYVFQYDINEIEERHINNSHNEHTYVEVHPLGFKTIEDINKFPQNLNKPSKIALDIYCGK